MRRPTNLTDYHAALYREGDVSIGAYARAQRRRRVLIGVAGALLIGGAVGLYIMMRPQESPIVEPKVPVYVECVSEGCGFKGVVRVAPDEARFPLVCPKCGQRSCQKVWVCRDCGRRVPHRAGYDELRCPYCGSQRVGTAEEPVAKAPN